MRKSLVLSVCLVAAPLPAAPHLQEPAAPAADPRAVVVRVEPAVELCSAIFRFAGNPEYSQGKVKLYADALDAHCAAHRDHAAVQLARKLRQTRGVGFDAVMGLAVHTRGGLELEERVPLDPQPASLDQRWTSALAREFLAAARAFARDVDFAGFCTAQAATWSTAAERMQRVLAERAHLEWFDGFFGVRPQARFQLVLGLLNGGACYGPHVDLPEGGQDLFCVLGVWQTDAAGAPDFDATVLDTVVHEFCHSYCNPLIDAHAARFEQSGPAIFAHVRDAMRRQAYGNWRTMLYESLVRACVVRYMAKHGGAAAEAKQIAEEHGNSFLWTGELAALLGRYEAERARFATLDAFMPEVAALFAAYAPKLDAQMAALPKVKDLMPANGSEDVDPTLGAITITFDRPMRDGAWSVVGGGPHFPEMIGKPKYDATKTILTLPVKLKPDWSYELWLNRGKFDSFASADGTKLAPLRVTFKTRRS